jgi:translation initiation factor 2B subunit (eIF-2B alpha/beta/delta family)
MASSDKQIVEKITDDLKQILYASIKLNNNHTKLEKCNCGAISLVSVISFASLYIKSSTYKLSDKTTKKAFIKKCKKMFNDSLKNICMDV